ncbi:hypothetical protein [Streptomyces sp. CA2R106]|uniref:hypothetical protein n=1 Tax=Streptomyces sp. CA2R106 TaxID=3120153 RepID=UPI0030090DDD
MVFILYLAVGFLFYSAAGTLPGDPLLEVQADPSRPPRRSELAALLAVWLIALVFWPLAVVVRGVRAISEAASRRR